jgi:hypothetical protein
MCTGNPALFSAVPIPQSQFDNDLQVIAKCHVPVFRPKSCSTDEPNAVNDIVGRVWRTAHPNAFGQQDIARAVESQLGTL